MSSDRQLFEITGSDRGTFLQGLVTNDVTRLSDGGIVYAALLSPHGKYLADFFLVPLDPDTIGLDVKASIADALFTRLNMYRLRADVRIRRSERPVSCGTGPVPDGAFADPRHPALGWRAYGAGFASDATDWDTLRVAHKIPETGIELVPDTTFILEAGFEALNGVDFRKGCYVGQEITARMKHKTELRKGLVRVQVSEPAPVGAELIAEGKPVGVLYTQAQGFGLAQVRFDRAQGGMRAGSATVLLVE